MIDQIIGVQKKSEIKSVRLEGCMILKLCPCIIIFVEILQTFKLV